MQIDLKDGVHYLAGELNEFSDFSDLEKAQDPLQLNVKGLTRLNSIGIRNLLKFLSKWGSRPFSYHECTSELIDQINMIPALLGTARQGKVIDLFVPFECSDCGHEHEFYGKVDEFNGPELHRTCPKCGGKMTVLTDSFFVFRDC